MSQDLNQIGNLEGNFSRSTLQVLAVVTLLGILPGILVAATSFPFFVTVFAILRQGIGLQQSPPNMLLVGLSVFLTFFVMEETFVQAWQAGVLPFLENRTQPSEAFTQTIEPFRVFMTRHVDPNTFSALANLRESDELGEVSLGSSSLSIIAPSFILSELSRAFQIGFLIFLPFLIIDLVTAAILMSMGMMMVPPALVSLPFKLAFFVVVDGWALISVGLVSGYAN